MNLDFDDRPERDVTRVSEVDPTVRKLAETGIDRGDQSNLFRSVMGRVAGGVSVILSKPQVALAGMTVNSLVSVSLDPLLVLFCARLESATARSILDKGSFSVNVLNEEQQSLSRYFAGRGTDIPAFELCSDGEHVWIGGAVGSLLCTVDTVHRAGDHNVIIGKVERIIDNPSRPLPLIYHEGLYRALEPVDFRANGRAVTAR